MKFINLTSTNPYYNLAFEEYILKNMKEDVFLLWQNDNTIVIGRNQNTLSEINMDYVKEHHINVVRRMSGGGAVYHDLGNLNYSFAINNTKNTYFDFETLTKPVISFLKSIGIRAELSGRNDLVIEGKKFSGNAQYAWHNRLLHHGTLLIQSDFSIMVGALNVAKQKIESKGIKSVKSRVTNVANYAKNGTMDVPRFKKEFVEFMLESDPTLQQYEPSQEVLEGVQALYETKYNTWDWNFGYSPHYTFTNSRKFETGLVQVMLDVADDGIISNAKFYGDFFSKKDIMDIEKALCQKKHEETVLEQTLRPFAIEEYFHGLSLEDIMSILF